MRRLTHRIVLIAAILAVAACSDVSNEPNTGGSGGTAGTGGTAGSGGTGGSTPAPTVTLSASPTAVATGGKTELSWTANNADSCTASDGWRDTRQPDGGPEDRFVYEDTRYELTCTGPGGSSSDEVDVAINTSQLLVSVDMSLYLVTAGDVFDVDVTVSNPGSLIVQNVFVNVVIPQYVIINLASLPANASCTGACEAGDTIEWPVGDVAAGSTTVGSVESEVSGDVPDNEDIVFESTVTADGEPNAVVSENTTEGISDFGLALLQTPSSPQAGDQVVYSVSYENGGGETLDNVEITLTLPPQVVFLSASDGGTAQGGVVTWVFPQLGPGANGQVDATVDVDPDLPPGAQLRAAAGASVDGVPLRARARTLGAVVDETAECQSSLDCDEGEICDDATKQCVPHVLASVEVNPVPIRRGEYAIVKITVSNPGPNVETVDVDMVLPQGLLRVGASNISSGGACGFACDPGDVLSWTIQDLEPGQSELLWFRARVGTSSSIANGTIISFTANAATVDGFQLQDTAATVVQNERPFELRVSESANPARPGQELTYTIDFANRSADPLDPVELRFTVPDGTTHSSGVDTVVWDLDRLSPGTGGTREVTVTVSGTQPLGSQLEATTEILDVGSPDQGSTATTVTPIATTPLLATVEVNPDPVLLGEYLIFTTTVSNPGSVTKNADVVVTLPANMLRVAGSNISEGGSCGFACDPGDVLSWTIQDLEPGQSELLWFRARVGTSSSIANGTLIPYDVEVRATNEIPIWTADTVRVDNVRPLNLRVEEDSNPADPGQELTYTIDYANQSADPLDPVRLVFRVPEGTTHVSGESTVEFDLGRLNAGTGGTAEVTVTVNGAQPLGSQLLAITEIAEVGSPHQTSRATTWTSLSAASLTATVTVTPDPAGRGATLTVNIDVSNPNPTTTTADVVLPLPQFMLRVSSATISGNGTCGFACDPGDVIRWTVENLAQGEFEILSFQTTISTSSSVLDGTLIPYDVELRPIDGLTQWSADTVRVETP